MSQMVIFNGKTVNPDDISFSELRRGLYYGDGCFETIKCHNDSFLHFDTHIQRLHAGMKYLNLEPNLNSASLKSEADLLIKEKKLSESPIMLRIQVWRKGGRGYESESSSFHYLIEAEEVSLNHKPVRLTMGSHRSIPNEALSRSLKLSNSLNYIVNANEASRKGYDDALQLSLNGYISETTSANIFWIKNSEVFTPGDDCDMLPGVTRNAVINILRNYSGFNVQTGSWTSQDLKKAEAVFTTNSLYECRTVQSLDDVLFKRDHSILIKIKELIATQYFINNT